MKKHYVTRNVVWHKTENPEFPYLASIDNESWEIRINDFPAESLYTLLIDGSSVLDFDDWPESWQRP